MGKSCLDLQTKLGSWVRTGPTDLNKAFAQNEHDTIFTVLTYQVNNDKGVVTTIDGYKGWYLPPTKQNPPLFVNSQGYVYKVKIGRTTAAFTEYSLDQRLYPRQIHRSKANEDEVVCISAKTLKKLN
jgi:hypothetical protein